MCGRFTQTTDEETIKGRFQVIVSRAKVEPKYNIAPTDPVLVVVAGRAGRTLQQFRWGLVPSWAKALKGGPQPINAKAETVATNGLFKKLLPTQRCLIVADSFYEWRKAAEGRVPMRIRLKDRGLFAFAGLWDRWRDPNDRSAPEIFSCTIITSDANDLVRPIHDRMPVILAPELEAAWLDRAVVDPARLQSFLVPYRAEAMDLYRVSMAVNDVHNQGKELIEPVAA